MIDTRQNAKDVEVVEKIANVSSAMQLGYNMIKTEDETSRTADRFC